jgi:hypothetical protein
VALLLRFPEQEGGNISPPFFVFSRIETSTFSALTLLLCYLGGLATALFFNYALHQPNKEWDQKMKQLEDNLYRNSGH